MASREFLGLSPNFLDFYFAIFLLFPLRIFHWSEICSCTCFNFFNSTLSIPGNENDTHNSTQNNPTEIILLFIEPTHIPVSKAIGGRVTIKAPIYVLFLQCGKRFSTTKTKFVRTPSFKSGLNVIKLFSFITDAEAQ